MFLIYALRSQRYLSKLGGKLRRLNLATTTTTHSTEAMAIEVEENRINEEIERKMQMGWCCCSLWFVGKKVLKTEELLCYMRIRTIQGPATEHSEQCKIEKLEPETTFKKEDSRTKNKLIILTLPDWNFNHSFNTYINIFSYMYWTNKYHYYNWNSFKRTRTRENSNNRESQTDTTSVSLY